MVYLITGGSGSGKSEYAEQLVMSLGERKRYYIATMEAFGEEGRRRVLRHRRLREGKGFLTAECPRNLGNISESFEASSVLLLECVSNLAANEMFGGRWEGRNRGEETEILADFVADEVKELAGRTADMVIVTNEVGGDGILYEEETMEYIRLMGLVNRRLAEAADQVIEVVYGIPVMLKKKEKISGGGHETD